MLCIVLQEDDEGHLTALNTAQDLMQKGEEIFLEHFARLGIFGKVLALAGPPPEEEEGAKAKEEKLAHVSSNMCGARIAHCLLI